MREWWNHIRKGPIPPALVVTGIVVLVAVRFGPGGPGPAEPGVFPTRGALTPGEGANITSRLLAEHESASVHHLRVEREVRAHFHRVHDETVVVLAGNGRIRLGEEWRDIEPGLVVVIPRGTVHAVEVGSEPVEAVSVFSPAFDGKDRLFVDE